MLGEVLTSFVWQNEPQAWNLDISVFILSVGFSSTQISAKNENTVGAPSQHRQLASQPAKAYMIYGYLVPKFEKEPVLAYASVPVIATIAVLLLSFNSCWQQCRGMIYSYIMIMKRAHFNP